MYKYLLVDDVPIHEEQCVHKIQIQDGVFVFFEILQVSKLNLDALNSNGNKCIKLHVA